MTSSCLWRASTTGLIWARGFRCRTSWTPTPPLRVRSPQDAKRVQHVRPSGDCGRAGRNCGAGTGRGVVPEVAGSLAPSPGVGGIGPSDVDQSKQHQRALNSNVLNSQAVPSSFSKYGSYLLSQTFPEGSPAHPAYPTGHGTGGGACIRLLKFFFDGSFVIPNPLLPKTAWAWCPTRVSDAGQITVGGELNKLALNVSFGHGSMRDSLAQRHGFVDPAGRGAGDLLPAEPGGASQRKSSRSRSPSWMGRK